MMLAAGKHAIICGDNEGRCRAFFACSYLHAVLRRSSSDSTNIRREGLNLADGRQAGGRSGREADVPIAVVDVAIGRILVIPLEHRNGSVTPIAVVRAGMSETRDVASARYDACRGRSWIGQTHP